VLKRPIGVGPGRGVGSGGGRRMTARDIANGDHSSATNTASWGVFRRIFGYIYMPRVATCARLSDGTRSTPIAEYCLCIMLNRKQ